jgi:hypothetical protein
MLNVAQRLAERGLQGENVTLLSSSNQDII